MSDIVVDTNVWVMVDKLVTVVEEDDVKTCVRACQLWLEEFISGDDRLVVDSYSTHTIISEYRSNVKRGGVAENLLNQLTNQLLYRLVQKDVRLDDDGFAELPGSLSLRHGKDRKFVAVAIQCDPIAPIYNATDTDWAKEESQLRDYGLTIHELCPEYIQPRISAS